MRLSTTLMVEIDLSEDREESRITVKECDKSMSIVEVFEGREAEKLYDILTNNF